MSCPGCGLGHEARGLDPPRDLDASGECHAEFGIVAAAFYSEPDLVPARQYVVDAYACQHPSGRSRRAVQRTALSLMTLDLVLETGLDVALGPRLHREMVRGRPDVFTELARPALTGVLTHRHVARAQDEGTPVDQAARKWAESVWRAWSVHHAQVRAWNRLLVPGWLPAG